MKNCVERKNQFQQKSIETIVESLVEVRLKSSDSFLIVKETLTRMGIASTDGKKLFQSCHILHKRGLYYIAHFKELFMLDGRFSDFSEQDLARRNTIANMLQKWGLVDLVNPQKSETPVLPEAEIKVIRHDPKSEWTLVSKYTIGAKKFNSNSNPQTKK